MKTPKIDKLMYSTNTKLLKEKGYKYTLLVRNPSNVTKALNFNFKTMRDLNKHSKEVPSYLRIGYVKIKRGA